MKNVKDINWTISKDLFFNWTNKEISTIYINMDFNIMMIKILLNSNFRVFKIINIY